MQPFLGVYICLSIFLSDTYSYSDPSSSKLELLLSIRDLADFFVIFVFNFHPLLFPMH